MYLYLKTRLLELKFLFLFGMEDHNISKNPIDLTPVNVGHRSELVHGKKTVKETEGRMVLNQRRLSSGFQKLA